MTNLKTFSVRDNLITGSIPTTWSTWSNIQDIYLSDNQLVGTLPTVWSNLSTLLYLGLAGNQLTGTLPSDRSSLTNLLYLDLSVNQLTGTLPSDRSSLTNLLYLDLSKNQLVGSLPDGWSSWVNINHFDVSYNDIDGLLPDGWSSRTQIADFFASNNKIRGSVPSAWQASRGNPLTPYIDLDSNCVVSSGYPSPVQVWLDNNAYLTNQYACLVYSAGGGGTVSGDLSQKVAIGGNGTIVEAIPSVGNTFAGWDDGSLDNPRTDLSVTGTISVVALFAGTGGSIISSVTSRGSVAKDDCLSGDMSASFYDGLCIEGGTGDVLSGSESIVLGSDNVTGSISDLIPSISDGARKDAIMKVFVFCSSYTGELQRAYCFAQQMHYTITDDIPLSTSRIAIKRSTMAFISSRFMSIVGLREADSKKECLFSDVLMSGSVASVQKACQMGLIGIDADHHPLSRFHPYRLSSKREFLTIVSRILSDAENENNVSEDGDYADKHINYLYNTKVIRSKSSQGSVTRDFTYLTLYKVVKLMIMNS